MFEAIRVKKGGGTAIAIHEDLKPKLIEEHSDEYELLVVEIKTKDKDIRIMSGYGPQENIEEDKRIPFFLALETAIERAELAGKSVFIEIDANSKLGNKYIANDPHDMSTNGRLLADIIERRNLILCNGTDKCSGTITRKRVTRNRCEQSAIDMVIVSSDMKEHLESMHIDEERKHVLSKIYKTKNGVNVKESDHNTILTKFNLKIDVSKDDKKTEVFNLKNKECQAKFKDYTSKTNMLSSIFKGKNDDIDDLTNRLVKKIHGCIAVNFKKRRVSLNKDDDNNNLYDKMRDLKGKDDAKSKTELNKVIKDIAEKSEENFNKLK